MKPSTSPPRALGAFLVLLLVAASLLLRPAWSFSLPRGRGRSGGTSAARTAAMIRNAPPLPPTQWGLLQSERNTKLSSSALLESSSSSAGKTSEGGAAGGQQFDEKQLDFTMGYLNKHHRDMLTDLAIVFTELGEKKAKRNAFSGGSFRLQDARIVSLNAEGIDLDVTVKARSNPEAKVERVSMKLDVDPIKAVSMEYKTLPLIPPAEPGTNPVDDFIRRMNRLCLIVDRPSVTGKLIRLGIQIGGTGVGELHENLFLNQVPHNRYVRQYFYDMASAAALDAVIKCSEGKLSNRMKMTVMFPEMNPSMDSYRIGTILELARAVGIKLAEQNLRVRICVQQSMGVGIFTGVPKQLNGVSTLLRRMDWQSGEGEENEGMVGNYINFGGIGKEHVVNAGTDRDGDAVVEQDDVFILLCPQSMVGLESSIIGPLTEMVDAAGDRPVILINPDLTDKVSSQGQQGVRGRKERMDFADSFKTVFHFTNTYVSGTSYFPILGALCKMGPSEPWVAHQRRDLLDKGELYVPVLSTEDHPAGDLIMSTFEK